MNDRKDSKETRYLELAREICKITKIGLRSNEQLHTILGKLRLAQQTPYMTSTQREIRKTIGEIVEMIEEKKAMQDIKLKISKLEDDVVYDTNWE